MTGSQFERVYIELTFYYINSIVNKKKDTDGIGANTMVRPYRFIDYLLWQVKETLLKTIDKPCSSQPKRGVTDSTLPATNCCVLYRLKKVIDNAVGSQPKRHHILRCCVRPFAVVLVDSFW